MRASDTRASSRAQRSASREAFARCAAGLGMIDAEHRMAKVVSGECKRRYGKALVLADVQEENNECRTPMSFASAGRRPGPMVRCLLTTF